jgi:hypothetical protein
LPLVIAESLQRPRLPATAGEATALLPSASEAAIGCFRFHCECNGSSYPLRDRNGTNAPSGDQTASAPRLPRIRPISPETSIPVPPPGNGCRELGRTCASLNLATLVTLTLQGPCAASAGCCARHFLPATARQRRRVADPAECRRDLMSIPVAECRSLRAVFSIVGGRATCAR